MEHIDLPLDLDELARHWPLPTPWSLQATLAGSINRLQVIATPTGSFVIRTHMNHPALDYEHAVLTALHTRHLPFRVPVPVSTHAGTTYVDLSEKGNGPFVSLTPLLPGSPPQQGNLQQAHAAGRALGHLVTACSQIAAPTISAPYGRYCDVHLLHPLATDPHAVVQAIPVISSAQKRRLLGMLTRLEGEVPRLYATLPQHLLHRDYFPNNVLMQGDAVSAVLDWEFVGEDVRTLDFAIGLTWWVTWRGTLESWDMFEAFGQGYRATGTLTEQEARAVPTLALLRYQYGVLFFAARCLDGRQDWQTSPVPFLTQAAVTFLEWLDEHEGTLTARALEWAAPANQQHAQII